MSYVGLGAISAGATGTLLDYCWGDQKVTSEAKYTGKCCPQETWNNDIYAATAGSVSYSKINEGRLLQAIGSLLSPGLLDQEAYNRTGDNPIAIQVDPKIASQLAVARANFLVIFPPSRWKLGAERFSSIGCPFDPWQDTRPLTTSSWKLGTSQIELTVSDLPADVEQLLMKIVGGTADWATFKHSANYATWRMFVAALVSSAPKGGTIGSVVPTSALLKQLLVVSNGELTAGAWLRSFITSFTPKAQFFPLLFKAPTQTPLPINSSLLQSKQKLISPRIAASMLQSGAAKTMSNVTTPADGAAAASSSHALLWVTVALATAGAFYALRRRA